MILVMRKNGGWKLPVTWLKNNPHFIPDNMGIKNIFMCNGYGDWHYRRYWIEFEVPENDV